MKNTANSSETCHVPSRDAQTTPAMQPMCVRVMQEVWALNLPTIYYIPCAVATIESKQTGR